MEIGAQIISKITKAFMMRKINRLIINELKPEMNLIETAIDGRFKLELRKENCTGELITKENRDKGFFLSRKVVLLRVVVSLFKEISILQSHLGSNPN